MGRLNLPVVFFLPELAMLQPRLSTNTRRLNDMSGHTLDSFATLPIQPQCSVYPGTALQHAATAFHKQRWKILLDESSPTSYVRCFKYMYYSISTGKELYRRSKCSLGDVNKWLIEYVCVHTMYYLHLPNCLHLKGAEIQLNSVQVCEGTTQNCMA